MPTLLTPYRIDLQQAVPVLRQVKGLVHVSPNALKLHAWHAPHRVQITAFGFSER